MPKIDLHAAFALGGDSPVAAQQVFTDRVEEVAAFDAAVETLHSRLATEPMSPVTDRAAPRRNVLVYYGVGGIGKSALSHELRRRCIEPEDGGHRLVAIPFDLGDAGGFDLESYLLRIRAGLSVLSPGWPAFDLAFTLYWARAHPGEPLDRFMTQDSLLRTVLNAADVPGQISSTVVDILTEAVPDIVTAALPSAAGVAREAVGQLTRALRQAYRRHRLLRSCELFGTLLEADADLESLSYFPYLIACDLERRGGPAPHAAIFLDTFEAAGSEHEGTAEQWLRRSAWLLPNVLFVVTGRDRLTWADAQSPDQLHVGPQVWPGLRAGETDEEPRQHLVGYLSDADAEDYLRQALVEDGGPAIPAEIRARVVAAGRGLPLYLDLAVTIYLDMRGRGHDPQPGDFGQSLPKVVHRLLRDLEKEERQLLRSAALVEAFDGDLLRAACPEIADACLRRFRDRPFLEVHRSRAWPYSLHAILRRSILDADEGLPDSWSARERAAAAARMAGDLERRAAQGAVDGDRHLQLAAVQTAVDLGDLTAQFFDWLVAAAQRLLTSGGWQLAPRLHADALPALRAFALGLAGARERRLGALDRAVRLFDDALAVDDLPAPLRDFLLLHRGHALRVSGRYADADTDYLMLASGGSGFAQDARYWHADHEFLVGRFDAALANLDELEGVSGPLGGEVLRLRGHVQRVNGRFAAAERHYQDALELAEQDGNAAAAGKALTDIVQARSWSRPKAAERVWPRAYEVNEGLGNKVELVKLHAATGVALTRLGRADEAASRIATGHELTGAIGYRGGSVWCWVAEAFLAWWGGDEALLRRAVDQVGAVTDDIGGNRFWADVVRWWAGVRPSSRARWLDGPEETARRWSAVGQRRPGGTSP